MDFLHGQGLYGGLAHIWKSIIPDRSDWKPKELGAIFHSKRNVNLEALSTAVLMMNANVQSINDDWYIESVVPGSVQHIMANNAMPLFSSIGIDTNTYVDRLQIYNGVVLETRVNFIFGYPPADEILEIVNPDGSISKSPVYIPPTPPFSARSTAPPSDIYYDNQLNILRVKSDDYFAINERLRFAPFTLMVPQQNWNVLEIFHDPTINDSDGLYIQPIYMDNAFTIWDALRRVADRLEKGADIGHTLFLFIHRGIWQ